MYQSPQQIWNPRIDSVLMRVKGLLSLKQWTNLSLKLKTKALSTWLKTITLLRKKLILPQGESKMIRILNWIEIFTKSLKIWAKTSKCNNIWSNFRPRHKINIVKINKIVQKVVIIKETKRIIYNWIITNNSLKIRFRWMFLNQNYLNNWWDRMH